MKMQTYVLSCKTSTALHIGGQNRPDDVSDSMFRRTADGRIVLPGTSIAGAIRNHLTRIIPAMNGVIGKTTCDALTGIEKRDSNGDLLPCACILCHLMGDIRPLNNNEADEDMGRASRLIVNDAILNPNATHIRDGVGIDRISGTASRQAQAKFDLETVPANVPFELVLELEDYTDVDAYLLQLALHEWQSGRIHVGGNSSRGMGLIAITDIKEVTYDLAKPANLLAYLKHDASSAKTYQNVPAPKRHSAYFAGYQAQVDSVQHWLDIRFQLAASGFFLTNDTTQAIADNLDHYSNKFIPGSSLRGAIRNHAERIARTIANWRAGNEAEFLAICPASDPLVMRWSHHDTGLESTTSRIDRSQTLSPEIMLKPPKQYFDLAEQLFGTTLHGSRLRVEDAQLSGKAFWKKIDFVAIDRFTGGAADKMKFDAYALWQPTFACRMFFEAPEAWEIGWLLQVFEDMQAGLVPVGFGAAKGFGDVHLNNLELNLGYAHAEVLPKLKPVDDKDDFFKLTTLDNRQDYIQEWRDRVNNFTVHADLPHNFFEDPYWSGGIATLYPRNGGLNHG